MPRTTKSLISVTAPLGVISKVFSILEAIHGAPYGSTLKQICEATAINKSTAHRFLKHMEREGYLVRTESGSYLIGPRLSEMGTHTNNRAVLQAAARPILLELWKATPETVNLAVLDGGTALYGDGMQGFPEFRSRSRVRPRGR